MPPQPPSDPPSPTVPPMPPARPQFTSSPPPMYAPPPPRQGFPVWALILLGCGCVSLLLIVVLAAVMVPVFTQARQQARTSSCMSNEKQMGLAMVQYVQDYDQKLPTSQKWMDKTDPYLRRESAFHCPAVSPRMTEPDKYGYAFNAKVSGLNMEKIDSPAFTLLIFESKDLQRSAVGTEDTVAYRHQNRANFCFTDGHVEQKGGKNRDTE